MQKTHYFCDICGKEVFHEERKYLLGEIGIFSQDEREFADKTIIQAEVILCPEHLSQISAELEKIDKIIHNEPI